MHVIWKRPDGFQNAIPDDFRRIALSNGAHLWLHRHELDWYPFQVSGDWTGQEQTKRLNRLINLLDAPDASWKHFLDHYFDDDLSDGHDGAAINSIITWIEELKVHVRGNTWEVEITKRALNDVQERIKQMQSPIV